MSRRAAAPHRTILPDPKFGNDMLAKFINMVMERGKKSAAEKIVYGAIDRIGEKKSGAVGGEAIAVLQQALDNVKPVVEVKSRRVGGATYQVPVEVRPRRAGTLSIRWLVGYSKQRREKTMSQKLAAELLDASNGVGAAVKRREDMHKMAESNKAFAHYRW
jgi:small subunit ribosomal protein S7